MSVFLGVLEGAWLLPCRSGSRTRLAVTAAAFCALLLVALFHAPAPALAAATWGPWTPAQDATVGTMPVVYYGLQGVSAVFQNALTDPVIATAPPRDCTVDGVVYVARRIAINTHSELTCGMVPTRQLSDGFHFATLGTWVGGAPGPYTRHSTSWSFDLQAPPALSTPVPANGWVSSVARPPIGLTVDENGPGTQPVRIQLSIDTIEVFDGVVNDGPWTWTPTSDFGTNTSHNVVATVTDASGNSSNLTWAFSVVAAPPMSIGGSCTRAGCHEYYPSVHPIGNCTACHSYGTEIGDHDVSGDPALIDGPPAPGGPCLDCHQTYQDHSATAVASDCPSCHIPAWPSVPQHGDADTATMHLSTSSGCFDAGCHRVSLVDEHARYPIGADFTYECSLCHDAGVRQQVEDAVTAGSTNCDACHTIPDHTASHDGPSLSSGCAECHKSDVMDEHQSDCDKCHASTVPRVIAAIAGNESACSACHTPGFHAPGFWSIKSDYYQWTTTPGPRNTGPALGTIGDNPTNPGAHGNYLATTAKCGMCHSVHRAAGDGVKLLPTADATCAGCHTGSTSVTAKTITVTGVNTGYLLDGSAGLPGGGGGPHNDGPDALYEDGNWDGVGTPPAPGYALGTRYGCFTRRCHATNPHGVGSSRYKIFAAKLLFNDSPEDDDAEYPELVAEVGNGTYGGLDAVWDGLGATDAAVERFVAANSSIMSTTAAGDILINGVAPNAAETHALVAGLTCGRPSNAPTGEDECHAEASYAIVDKGIKENRNHATGMTGNDGSNPLITDSNAYRTDNTGVEAPGRGGNDNRDSKTGHVAGSFAAAPDDGSYAPIAGCTSCHDQTDDANTVVGNFTFPHGQTATGLTNLVLADGVTTATGTRSRIWAGYAGSSVVTKTVTDSVSKAYDGQCLKCHRDGAGNGIGVGK